MLNTYIHRYEKTSQGSFGIFSIPELEFSCHSLELPWKNNRNSISCVAAGDYVVTPYYSRKFGLVFILKNVKNRSYILIHVGNWAGDKRKGLRTDSHGCILVGKQRGVAYNQRAILNSRITIRKLKTLIGKQNFMLHIS